MFTRSFLNRGVAIGIISFYSFQNWSVLKASEIRNFDNIQKFIIQEEEVSSPEIYHSYLQHDYICQRTREKELEKLDAKQKIVQQRNWKKLLENPNFLNPEENSKRNRMLLGSRRWFISELPPEARFKKVKICFSPDLEKHIIAPWSNPEIFKKSEISPQDYLHNLIFVQTRSGKLFLIEGNNRYAQWRIDGSPELETEVYLIKIPDYEEFSWDPDSSETKLMDYDNKSWL